MAPWLLFGLVVAGLLKVFFPQRLMAKWLGGRGVGPVVRAALLGTPVPLCSCSVLPAAIALRRNGASKGATVSFLIATPENGADSIAITYVLLGPFMTVVRPVAAIISAVFAGMLTEAVAVREKKPGASPLAKPQAAESSCCDDGCCDEDDRADPGTSHGIRAAMRAIYVAAVDLLDDIALWLLLGLLLAAAIATFVPTETLSRWSTGMYVLPAMLLMLVIAVPMYICATASTPVAAAMLIAGVSPGTVLVLLLAGPATNLASMGVVRRELGGRVLAAYLVGICLGAVATGLVTDVIVRAIQFNIPAQAGEAGGLVPRWLAVSSTAALVVLTIRPVRRALQRRTPRAEAPPVTE